MGNKGTIIYISKALVLSEPGHLNSRGLFFSWMDEQVDRKSVVFIHPDRDG